MLNGKRCKVTQRKGLGNEEYYGVIYSEASMDSDGNWFVVVRKGNKLISVDVYFIEIDD